MGAALILHAAATTFMGAASWYVQLVHYPRLAAVPPEKLPGRAAANITRTSVILGPVMATELVTAGLLVLNPPARAWAAYAGAGLLAAAWGSTLLVQFPIHRRLANGGDARELARLIRTNWVRVALWTARALLALRLAA